MADSIGLSETLKIVLGTGFVTTILNQIVGWFLKSKKENEEKKLQSKYLALRVAVVLESFALNCASKISDGSYFEAVGASGNLDLSIPSIEKYPIDGLWSSMPSNLAARVLSFPNILELGRQEFSGWWLEGDPQDRLSVALGYLGKYGLHAWHIAVDLRLEFQLPTFSPKDTSWDAIACLRREAEKIH